MTSLPIPLTSFIGREKERSELLGLAASARLVTLTGAGGCGKTRLALSLVNEIKDMFPDGIFWVDLAFVMEPVLIPQVLAKALNTSTQAGDHLIDTVISYLEARSVLVVLDNCEHLVPECALLVGRLLQASKVTLIITSREPLSVEGEIVYPVLPFSMPPVQTDNMEMQKNDAVRLFAERASAVLPGFQLTSENTSVVASICRQLDGIPLAIELASAWIDVLTVEQIADRLSDRFTMLNRTNHAMTGHHHSMKATLDWSHDLLSEKERILFRRLSVFSGGCSLATVESVCAGGEVEREGILDLQASLISKSLAMSQTLARSEARYSLLETIRQYSSEKLMQSGEMLATRDRHLNCFVQLTEDVLPKLSGPDQQLWLTWLESEMDNIRAALDWSTKNDRIEEGLRILVAIYQFLTIRDYAEEGLIWMERLLSQAGDRISPVIHANALAYAVFLAGFRGDAQAQIKYGQKAGTLVESVGEEKSALKWALVAQAYGVQAAGDYETQFNIMKQVIQLNRDAGDKYQLALTLSTNSFTAMSLAKYEEAHAMLAEALSLLREVGNPYRIAMALNFSGDLARCELNYDDARAFYEECISLLRRLVAPRDLASALQNLGYTCLHLGEIERGRGLFQEGMNLQVAQQNTPGIAECLMGFAATAIESRLPAAGARLLAAALKIGGQRLTSAWAATKLEYEHYVSLLRTRLKEDQFKQEQIIGTGLSLAQAVEFAEQLFPLPETKAGLGQKAEDLTAREREIAVLIALGKTNGEIADELVLSKRTIEKHVAHILMKLGGINRAQIVRWAMENGLLKSTG